MQQAHYIFTGSGLSALLTVYEMLLSGKFKDKTILLIDENPKKTNDRTWCFWDEKALFEELVSTKWSRAVFANETINRVLELHPFQYKKINGIDFYHFVFQKISGAENIQFLNEKVLDYKDFGTHCEVRTASETYTCNKVINSIYNPDSCMCCPPQHPKL
jgi:lycopene beta-cyclase